MVVAFVTNEREGQMPAPQVSDAEIDAALPADLRFDRRIGVGGQRVVCLLDREGVAVVLKLMNEEARERAEREVAVGQRFEHPGLSKILGELLDLEVAGTPHIYFLEEYIEGDSLDTVSGMDLCEVLALGEDLTRAAEYLYEHHHLVHRDIKPANIMRRKGGGFVLLDVGIARHQDLDTLTAYNSPHGPGTAGYLAPEQLVASKGHEMDSRADQFAIGVVMFEALCGRVPFDPGAGSYRTLLTTGTVGDWGCVPEPVRPLLERMLQPKPHRRYRPGHVPAAIDEAKEAAECS
jgi:serine/threonine-protein kinase